MLLSREITAEGKSSCRINGMPATAAVLRELCGGLININGQHDSVGLLNPAHIWAFWTIMRKTAFFRSTMPCAGSLVRGRREGWMPPPLTEALKSKKKQATSTCCSIGGGDRGPGLTAGEEQALKTAGKCCPMRLLSGIVWRRTMRYFPAVDAPGAVDAGGCRAQLDLRSAAAAGR